MIAASVPVAIDDFFGGAFVVAEDEAGDGNADADEVVVVGAAEEIAFGLEIGADFDIEFLGDCACGGSEGGIVEAFHGENVEGEDGSQLVQVEVGYDTGSWHRGVSGEVCGAE